MVVDFSGVTEIIFASKDIDLTKLIIENKTLGNKVLWEKHKKVVMYKTVPRTTPQKVPLNPFHMVYF